MEAAMSDEDQTKKYWQLFPSEESEYNPPNFDFSNAINFDLSDQIAEEEMPIQTEKQYLYGDSSYGQGMTGTETASDFLTGMSDVAAEEGAGVAGTGLPTKAGTESVGNLFKAFLSNPSFEKFTALMKSDAGKYGATGLMALLAAMNRAEPSGGGFTGTPSPTPTNRTMVQGKYGPLAQYAATGGLMQAYASGGMTSSHQKPFQMEDGGFVMTKKAVDGAGGHHGLARMIPGVRPIVGPGTGTSDSIPATIAGRTPARVSNGEAYVPRHAVNRAGGVDALYALMNHLQRRA